MGETYFDIQARLAVTEGNIHTQLETYRRRLRGAVFQMRSSVCRDTATRPQSARNNVRLWVLGFIELAWFGTVNTVKH